MDAVEAAEGEVERALRRLGADVPYAEAVAQRAGGMSAQKDKEATHFSQLPTWVGAVFRYWTGDAWREASASGLSHDHLTRTVDALRNQARKRSPRGAPPGALPKGNRSHESADRSRLADFDFDQRLDWIRTAYGWGNAVPGIFNVAASMFSLDDERLFLSTSGARRLQKISRVRAGVRTLAKENGRIEWDYVSEGGTGGPDVLAALTEEKVVATAKEAIGLLRSGAPPTGEMNVVLDPSTTGTFAHESFGHGTEADQILRNRSYLKPLLGEMVGPESLSIVDQGSYPKAWGEIFFDDEGQPAARTPLIDHGRFVGVLHDRETAQALGKAPTGNARRADFLSRVFVRMTNTFVEPGEWSREELIREAKDGVLLQNFTSGIEDPLGGNMQIKVKKGRHIRGGELGGLFSSSALSGKVLEVLKEIRGISGKQDFALDTGFCGKGITDTLPVGAGGPYLLTRAVVGPG